MRQIVKLSEIKIDPSFAESKPKKEKMEECRSNYILYGKQDRDIVVNNRNVLIDGYIMYLVLKENNVENAKIKISNYRRKCWHRINLKEQMDLTYRTKMTTYIYGVHLNSKYKNKKEFLWRVPSMWVGFGEQLEIGDSILCDTKFGVSPVIVTRIEMSEQCPVDFPVKLVISKEIRKNNRVME